MFGTVLISVYSLMHIYVFWRVSTVPLVKRHVSPKTLILSGIIIWTIFFLGRVYGHHGSGLLAFSLEFSGMNLMAVIFLTALPLFAVDLVTIFGFIMPKKTPALRGVALAAGIVLSAIALIQGLRPPVIRTYDVILPNLPSKLDGTVIVAMSDMHLGSLIGERWLAARVAQVNDQHPDMVFLLGDIFEGHGKPSAHLHMIMNQMIPPLGIWSVPGNHESHGGKETIRITGGKLRVLSNQWAEVRPGLILAGVDDLTDNHRNNHGGDPVSNSLADRPPGPTILLSHTPWQAEKAARAGVNLMLCGHTHGGQIWPFDYLVRRHYPFLEGRYEVNGMTVIVSRGTGTWGPRMRLWAPGEILRMTLHTQKEN